MKLIILFILCLNLLNLYSYHKFSTEQEIIEFMCLTLKGSVLNNQSSYKTGTINTISKSLHYIQFTEKKGFCIYYKKEGSLYVVGFSDDGLIDESKVIPPALVSILELNIEFIDNNHKNLKTPDYLSDIEEVLPLIKTKWNQNGFYNDSIPKEPVTGCVATALAQLFKYWSYPERGTGSKSYRSSYCGNLFVDFANSQYKYSEMPISLDSHNSEVAKLMYHVGVSVEMSYSPSSSSANLINQGVNALRKHWDYNVGATLLNFGGDDWWNDKLKADLIAGKPILMGGSGSGAHAFLCDGFKNINYFHFNWGWGGRYDGYFYMNNLKPGDGNFSREIYAFLDVVPSKYKAIKDTLIILKDLKNNINDKLTNNQTLKSNYCNNTRISWLIDLPDNRNINIDFNYLDIGAGDYLKIWKDEKQSELLMQFDIHSKPIIQLFKTNKIFLEFIADDYTTGEGFDIFYTSLPKDIIINDLRLNCDTISNNIVNYDLQISNHGYDKVDTISLTVSVNDTLHNHLITQANLNYRDTSVFTFNMKNLIKEGFYELSAFLDNQDNCGIINHYKNKYYFWFDNEKSLYPFFYDCSDSQKNKLINIGGFGIQGNRLYCQAGNQTSNPIRLVDCYFNQRIGQLNENSEISFDFQAKIWDEVQKKYLPYNFEDDSKIFIFLTPDMIDYDTIITIDKNNYKFSEQYQKIKKQIHSKFKDSLFLYISANIKEKSIKFFSLDNFAITDRIRNNFLPDKDTLCRETVFTGSLPTGGLGKKKYIWQYNSGNNNWVTSNFTTNKDFCLRDFKTGKYEFRRIVTDFAGNSDTSNVSIINILSKPEKTRIETNDSIICFGTNVSRFQYEKLNNTKNILLLIEPENSIENYNLSENHFELIWNKDFTGKVKIQIAGENDCGIGDYSEPLFLSLADTKADFSYELNEGLSVNFTNNSIFADKYVWDFGDGTSSYEISPVHKYKNEGVFYVTLEASLGECHNKISKEIFVKSSNVNNDFTNKNGLKVIPSPASEYINILFEGMVEFLNHCSSSDGVFNILGVKVIPFEMLNPITNQKVDISSLSSGVYYIKIGKEICFFVKK